MNVLHIASWYPHSKDPFDGDFVERHAKAASLYMRVHVIHVVQQFHLLKKEEGHTEERTDGNLSSHIYFPRFPKVKSRWLQKIMFAGSYNRTVKLALAQYIEQQGKPDLIHLHVPVKAGYAALYMKRKWAIPFVVTEHSSAYYHHATDNYFSSSSYFRFITRQSFKNAIVVSSVSAWLLSRLKELFPVVAATRVIRNVVDTSLFYPVEKSKSRKRFIHVSMMFPMKNVEGIIDALYLLEQQTQDFEMIFIGNASAALQDKARGLGDKVHFAGILPYAEVAKHMQHADALVHFSTYENLPCVINEALCCGLPVISSRVGGIDEIVNDTNGTLVESKNTVALANAMLNFINKSHSFNSSQISSDATAKFSYETVGKEMVKMYEEAIRIANI